MTKIKYNDFNNICRTCLLSCDLKHVRDQAILDVFFRLTDIPFELSDELPQQICQKCLEKLNEIRAFSLQCKQADSSLMKCLNEFKNVQIKTEQETSEDLEETSELVGIKEEITIDELQFDKNQEELYLSDENVFDDLQIKAESLEVIINEFDDNVIPTTSTIDNEQHSDSDSDMKYLVKTDESTNENDRYKCDICQKTFKFVWYLKVHKRIHSDEHPYKCDVCQKAFQFGRYLKVHKRIHTNERPFQCDVCNKTFTHSNSLNNHKRIHSGECPYECNICKKTFKYSNVLIRHKRMHSDERPHKCDNCTKTFKTASDLKIHNRVHSGERPYKCDICNKAFAQARILYIHKKMHSGERRYVCEICNKAFSRSSTLNKHKLVHIGEPGICGELQEGTSLQI